MRNTHFHQPQRHSVTSTSRQGAHLQTAFHDFKPEILGGAVSVSLNCSHQLAFGLFRRKVTHLKTHLDESRLWHEVGGTASRQQVLRPRSQTHNLLLAVKRQAANQYLAPASVAEPCTLGARRILAQGRQSGTPAL